MEVLEDHLEALYQLFCNKTHQRLEPRLDLFEINEDGRLYYKGYPSMKRGGKLRETGVIADALGNTGL